jgi:dolichol-phosphate mannosyltransferase
VPKLSFVIPVYRNERAVTLTHQKLRAMAEKDLPNYAREFVFVDDGSDDNSLPELLQLRAQDPDVRIVSFTRNFGQMAAIQAGLKTATGDLVLHLSADLQDPVELIPQLVREFEAGNELVIAYRQGREDKLSSRLTSRVFYGIVRLSFPQIPPGGFDYVLMGRRVVDAFNQLEVRNRFFQGDLLWYLPIRFISLLGVLTAFLGFAYALNIVYYRFVHGSPFPGWAPIMVVVLVIGGLLMLMMGIIGEYVWRIFDEVRRKPNYVVRDIF